MPKQADHKEYENESAHSIDYLPLIFRAGAAYLPCPMSTCLTIVGFRPAVLG